MMMIDDDLMKFFCCTQNTLCGASVGQIKSELRLVCGKKEVIEGVRSECQCRGEGFYDGFMIA